MKAKTVYLILAALGVLVPYLHFWPWLAEHGLDVGLFRHELHASAVTEFFSADVMVSALATIAFLVYERRRVGRWWWIPVVALLTVGVSAGLPLLLYLREGRAGPRRA